MRFVLRWLVLSVAVSLMVAAVVADEMRASDTDDLSLEDLLQIKVVTPTRSRQSMAESPSVISVMTAEQLRDLGVTTLQEALGYFPGVLVTESYWGYTMVNVRGQLQIHYNNKVLLLINGHPTREVVNGNSHFELVPISAIARIEFVRGPGSALYGTNAFAGVVNIITKVGRDPAAREVVVGGGSFSTTEASVVYGRSNHNFDLMVAATTRDDAGYPYRITRDERGNSGEIKFQNDLTNALAVMQVGEVTLSTAAFRQDKSKFGIVPVIDYTGISHYRAAFLDLKWEHSITPKLDFLARARYDSIDRPDTAVGSFPYDGFEGHANAETVLNSSGHVSAIELTLDQHGSKHLSLLGGVVFERRMSHPYTFRFVDDWSLHPYTAYYDSPSAQELAVFGQALVSATPATNFVLGLRYVDDSVSGSVLLPRLGVVHRLGARTYLKALYAEAFRTPDFFQTDVATYNVLYGDPNLKPERTRNFDLAVDMTFAERVNLQLNAFYYTTQDQVVRTPTPTPETQGPDAVIYINAGGQRVWGLEASLHGQPGKKLHYFANYSYRTGRDRETGDDLRFIADHTFSGGLVWRALPRVAFKPNVQLVDSRGEAAAYGLVNLVVDLTLTPDLSLSLIGRNLGNKTYEYPEYIRNLIDVIPGGPQRAVFARLRWRY